MMRFFNRNRKAVKNWHSKAMLIDLRKTRLTIIEKRETQESED